MARELTLSSPVGKPWRFTGTSMAPNVLLMCKLLLLLLVVHGFWNLISDPHIPFLRFLDWFHNYPNVFSGVLKTAFLIASLSLFFNYRVRSASVGLGIVIILVILASKPVYRNHILIVGCLLFLAGLHREGEDPWLVKLQFPVMYFGAFVNKCFDEDWWTGQFMHGWLHGHLNNPFYEALSPLFPELGFALILSWTVIVCELLLAILFLVRRWHAWAIWLALAMHIGFLAVVGRHPFGHFTEDILIALLAFLSWPKGTIEMGINPRIRKYADLIVRWIDWDRQYRVTPLSSGEQQWLTLDFQGCQRKGSRALFTLFKYNVCFYIFLFFAFNGIAFLVSRYPF